MTPRLELTGIVKSFGATRALDGVDLTVCPCEVHAIIGENGAGKSTLMKVLSGAHRPDGGVIRLDGQELELADPRQSQAAGIAMIYQELNLAPDLSVVENITLGQEPTYAGWRRATGWIDRRKQKQAAVDALAKLHCETIPLDRPISELSIAQQQMIEIARAVATSSAAISSSTAATPSSSSTNATDVPGPCSPLRLLILDEPTSSLTQVDTEHLFTVIERLKEDGISVLYISHFLEECQHIADRFTVLRDGKSVGSGAMPHTTSTNLLQTNQPLSSEHDTPKTPDTPPESMESIIHMMVGRDVSQLYPDLQHTRGEVALELQDVEGTSLPKLVSLSVHHGEIFGIAGLIGAGRTETLRALFGLDSLAAGRVVVHGQTTDRRSPRSSWLNDSMGLVSEDRKNEGLFLNSSLSDNLTMTRLGDYRRRGLLSTSQMNQATLDWMERLDVKAAGPDQKIGELSGGNQQKIALGRLLHHDCDILLLDEPTRGIDIGSKQAIYQQIGELAAQGKAIVLVSSYLPELLGVCDRIGVFAQGRLTEIRNTDQWTEHDLLSAAI
ncbi:sugar ABC transporter ATP-binding protein [Neorhodopirellula lusitana]|uniref:sugar ABC transporter ATP-binding protein n=1 Tax=Neorhodopirellula lusitana TaxID=445327 RepID=UPI00384D0D88